MARAAAKTEPEAEAPRHPGGRPTLFQPEYVQEVEDLARRGLTDAEMADHFGVTVRTFYRWKIGSEEFCQALTVGKDHADNRVERSLYEQAVGYRYTEQQAFKVKVGQFEERVEVVEVERLMPADKGAASFWLKNRRRTEWRERIALTGPEGGAIEVDDRRSIDPRLISPDARATLRQILMSAVEQLAQDGGEIIEGEYSEREGD